MFDEDLGLYRLWWYQEEQTISPMTSPHSPRLKFRNITSDKPYHLDWKFIKHISLRTILVKFISSDTFPPHILGEFQSTYHTRWVCIDFYEFFDDLPTFWVRRWVFISFDEFQFDCWKWCSPMSHQLDIHHTRES